MCHSNKKNIFQLVSRLLLVVIGSLMYNLSCAVPASLVADVANNFTTANAGSIDNIHIQRMLRRSKVTTTVRRTRYYGNNHNSNGYGFSVGTSSYNSGSSYNNNGGSTSYNSGTGETTTYTSNSDGSTTIKTTHYRSGGPSTMTLFIPFIFIVFIVVVALCLCCRRQNLSHSSAPAATSPAFPTTTTATADDNTPTTEIISATQKESSIVPANVAYPVSDPDTATEASVCSSDRMDYGKVEC